MRHLILVCLVSGLLSSGPSLIAQTFVVNPSAAPVGSTVSFDLTNTTTGNMSIFNLGVPYRVFNESGTLVWGQGYFSDLITATLVAPGMTHSVPFNTASTPGLALQDGHYYAEVESSPDALMTKFTVGSATGVAPDFVFRMSNGVDVHAAAFGAPTLRLTNSSSSTQTLNGATWSVILLGNASPHATGSLPTVILGPGRSVDFAWPSTAFLSYPFTTSLSLSWLDPASGPRTQTIEASGAPLADHETCRIYLPGGSTVPASNALPVVVQPWVQAACLCPFNPYVPNNGFALLFALGRGNLPLPVGNGLVPLANDVMLQATLMGLRDAYTPGSPGIATGGVGLPNAGPIGLAHIIHPGPALSGLTVLMSAISWPTTLGSPLAQPWQASAARELTLQ